jgi:hypothetical protein
MIHNELLPEIENVLYYFYLVYLTLLSCDLRGYSAWVPGVTEDNHTNFVTIGCIPGKTGIGHLANTNERCYYLS